MTEPRTLIYDIETAPDILWGWGTGKKIINADQIIRPGKIICISYRFMDWPEDKVEHLVWAPKERESRFSYRWSDREVVTEFYKIAQDADVIVGHNGDAFDAKTINLRLAYYNVGSLSHLLSEDTLKQSRSAFKSSSYKLDYLCRYFNLPGKLATSSDLWKQVALYDNVDALKQMVAYGDNDVIILEQLYKRIYPYVSHKINKAVLLRDNVCPSCGSYDYQGWGVRRTRAGEFNRYKCNQCAHVFRSSKSNFTVEMR